MPKRVKLGLIGCGGYMHQHVANLEPIRSAQIAALADTNSKSLKRMQDRHPTLAELPTFSDYRHMLDEVELDGVVIATPHTLHYEHAMTSLDRGLHVLTEKPMVCTVEHAKAVMRKAKQKRRILMIGYQRHFSPVFRHARKLIASGKIGRPIFVAVLLAQEWLRGTRGTWRQNPALSGGGELVDSGSHVLDSILWVTNLEASVVSAEMHNRGTKVDILSSLTVRFKGGALGSIAVVGDAPSWWEEQTFYGEEGALYLRNDRLLLQSGFPRTKTTDVTDRLRYRGTCAKNFVNSILGREEPETPPVWGLRVVQLTEAAFESARTGQPAKVKR